MEKIKKTTDIEQQLKAEWHMVRNEENGSIGPDYSSNLKVWWMCEKGHEWRISPLARVKSPKNTCCPYCSNLLAIANVDDLSTTHPLIASQWHPTKNAGYKLNEITALNTRKAWWQCEIGHEWQAPTSLMVEKGWKCLRCYPKSVSKIATDMHSYLESTNFFTGLVQEKNMIKEIHRTTRVDTYGEFKGVGVVFEYDGLVFHNGLISGNPLSYHMRRDSLKAYSLLQAGFKVIRIRADGLPFLNLVHPNFMQLAHDSKGKQPLEEVIDEAILWLDRVT